MLTGDENVVNVQFNIQYHIKPGDGAVDYLFNVTQPDAVVKKAAEAAMREVIGKTTLEAALTEGRVKVQGEVTELLQDILDRYRVGVQVVAVQMQAVQPPGEVSEAFKDVASAREDKQRLANEAEAYRRVFCPRRRDRRRKSAIRRKPTGRPASTPPRARPSVSFPYSGNTKRRKM